MPSVKERLTPEFLARISHMELRARMVVEGLIPGLHQSPFQGYSLEFAQHRPYAPGDELKRLDWKVYGRTDRFFIKQFQEETNLRSYIMLDTSASMNFTSGTVTKLQYATYLAAAIAYILVMQDDSVALALYDNRIKDYLPPFQTKAHLARLWQRLEDVTGEGISNISAAVKLLNQNARCRGLVIVLSDLFDDPDTTIQALRYLRHHKHEVIVFHVLDPQERRLGAEGYINFVDMETGERLPCDAQVVKREHDMMVNNYLERMRLSCLSSDIDYFRVDTNTELDRTLAMYFAHRQVV